jgi:Ankyrin repeat
MILLRAGHSVNATDENGRTALHLAACEQNALVIHRLLSAGANPFAIDAFGNTPTDDCGKFGSPMLASLLEEASPAPFHQQVHSVGSRSRSWRHTFFRLSRSTQRADVIQVESEPAEMEHSVAGRSLRRSALIRTARSPRSLNHFNSSAASAMNSSATKVPSEEATADDRHDFENVPVVERERESLVEEGSDSASFRIPISEVFIGTTSKWCAFAFCLFIFHSVSLTQLLIELLCGLPLLPFKINWFPR